MAKVKVKASWAIVSLVPKAFDPKTKQELGDVVVQEAKNMISQGTSPVRGRRRFDAYKNRKDYPGDLKSARPVNLYLSGKMLSFYGWKNSGKNGIKVGVSGAPQKVMKYSEAHNNGTDNMPMRQHTPKDGEELAVTIMRKIRDTFKKRLSLLIRQSNKSK